MEKTREISAAKLPEPWLRGSSTDVSAVIRAVLHALELAGEDVQRWCGELTDAEVNQQPRGIASVAFHVRHIARSIDRLLMYAEGRALSEGQLQALRTEMEPGATREALFRELDASLGESVRRLRSFHSANLEEARTVGKRQLPTTLGGLLVHIADHTQRHVGQAITTAKIVRAGRSLE